MANKNGAFVEEEDEEEEINEEKEIKVEEKPIILAPDEKIEKKEPIVENNANVIENTAKLFTGKSTKHNVAFVRNFDKVKQLQEKAYSSCLQKCSSNLSSANDYAQSPLKYGAQITENSKNAKSNYIALSKAILAINNPLSLH